jgi:aspartyl/asparaginyl beta-hydroxylase (cupin superfamily)
MDHKYSSKIWYGIFGKPYEGIEPAYFETTGKDWAEVLEKNSAKIIAELSILFEQKNNLLTPYFAQEMQSNKTNWRTVGFFFWGKKNHDVNRMFPETAKILRQIPHLVSASVNMLEPNSIIKAHFGDTNAVYRCHLGLKIPDGLPKCGFKVKEEWRAWENGKLLIFLDAHTHSAQNNSEYPRFILLLDVMRPEFTQKKNVICSFVLAMLTMYRISEFFPFIKKLSHLPDWALKLILLPIQIIWLIYTPVQNKIGYMWA